MKNSRRVGMSDAHLRADLRAQNPLYSLSGSVTAQFERERCAYNLHSASDLNKTEYARRIEAIHRKERHIVQPPSYWLKAQLDHLAKISTPFAQNILRPSLSYGYQADRISFNRAQARLDERARMLGRLQRSKRELLETKSDLRSKKRCLEDRPRHIRQEFEANTQPVARRRLARANREIGKARSIRRRENAHARNRNHER